MKFVLAVAGACMLLLQMPAAAEVPSDPLSWLGRIASAGGRLNYVGTFMYQSGEHVEISRIAHRVDGSGEFERLEVLDGSPREVIRDRDSVRCVLPEQKTVIIDEPGGGRRAFPARLPVSLVSLGETYRIRKGGVSRVAGLKAQALVLEPRDGYRYGYRLWAEFDSGLLLKARTVDEAGRMIEQFTFSDVRIGGEVDDEVLKARFEPDEGWQIVDARAISVARTDRGWELADPPPGYVLASVMRRALGRNRGEAVHMVFSDGLAAVSVFIEPADEHSGPVAARAVQGAIRVYERIANGHRITALGEVPALAVQRIGDGIRPVER